MLTEKIVEKRYNIIDRDPILDNLEISDKEATPFIKEANTKGTAITCLMIIIKINFSKLNYHLAVNKMSYTDTVF